MDDNEKAEPVSETGSEPSSQHPTGMFGGMYMMSPRTTESRYHGILIATAYTI